jgi:hypothetical protein
MRLGNGPPFLLRRLSAAHTSIGMKISFAVIVALCLASVPALAQEAKSEGPKKISAAEAKDHYGETVIVAGKVAQVTVREKLVYLNLDKEYPDMPLSGMIFARSTNEFGDLKQLEGKQVEIKGRIDEYRGKLQIILESTNQLKVVESKEAEKGK